MSNNRYIDYRGVVSDAPRHWTSNEAWPDAAVMEVIRSAGDTAITVGSANLASIAPLIPGLNGVCVLDVVPGQVDLFASRGQAAARTLRRTDANPGAVRSVSDLMNLYIAEFNLEQPYLERKDVLISEWHTLDILRSGHTELHYATSFAGLERLCALNVTIGEFLVDITKPGLAAGVQSPPNTSRVGWVHLSNVAMTEFRATMRDPGNKDDEEKVAHRVASSIIDFIGGLRNVDGDTVVTYACYDHEVKYGDSFPPVVVATTLDSLSTTQLLSAEDRDMSGRVH